jgi:hypothetical protein
MDTHPFILVNRVELLEKKEHFMGSISSKMAVDDFLCAFLGYVDCVLIWLEEL